MDLTDKAPEGPGWYIHIVGDGQPFMTPMPVPAETAYQLSLDFARAMQDSEHELPQFAPGQLVQSANQFIQQALQEQLRQAEEWASRIPSLRKRLATAPINTPNAPPPA